MLKMELTKNVFFLIFLCGFYGFGEDMGIIRGPMYSSGAHALSPYNTYIYISLSLSLYIYIGSNSQKLMRATLISVRPRGSPPSPTMPHPTHLANHDSKNFQIDDAH